MGSWGGWAVLALVAQQQTPGGGSESALPPATGGYAVQLFQSVLALAAVCVAAWWLLRWASKRGLGRAPAGRNVRVLERVVLDGRRCLYLVRVGPKVLLLGGTDGALATLGELRPEDLLPATMPPDGARAGVAASFRDVLARLRGVASSPGPARDAPSRGEPHAAAVSTHEKRAGAPDAAPARAEGSPPGDELL